MAGGLSVSATGSWQFLYTRTLNFGSEVSCAELPSHLADCLRGVEARRVTIEGNRVLFRGGLLRLVDNWNVLCPFGFGDVTVDVDHHRVQYRLSFRQIVLFGAAMTLFITVFGSIASRSWHVLAAIPFFLLMLVGGHLAVGLGRFESFLRHAVETAPRC